MFTNLVTRRLCLDSKYSSSFNAGPGLNQCWVLDTTVAAADLNIGFKGRHDYIIEKSDPKGSFRFAIDLEHVFGFCEDYDKVMYHGGYF